MHIGSSSRDRKKVYKLSKKGCNNNADELRIAKNHLILSDFEVLHYSNFAAIIIQLRLYIYLHLCSGMSYSCSKTLILTVTLRVHVLDHLVHTTHESMRLFSYGGHERPWQSVTVW